MMLMDMADHPVLFIPGPTEVDDELRQIMAMPLLGHRDPKFVATVQDVCQKPNSTSPSKPVLAPR